MTKRYLLGLLTITLLTTSTFGADAAKYGLKTGDAGLAFAGPMAFGPDGILFVGDPKSACVFAFDTADKTGDASKAKVDIAGINKKIAGMLGVSADKVTINDLSANPASGNVYLSVSRGRGPDAQPVLMRVTGKGLEVFEHGAAAFSKYEIPNPVADKVSGQGRRRRNQRMESITDIAYIDGRVVVAGLSNEEFASNLRAMDFPFSADSAGTSVEVFHGAHGRLETRSPVRTFAPLSIDGEPHLLAAYTCTPLVKFPVAALGKDKLTGTTVAELGNRNRPLDMIVYRKDGKDWLLMANSARGVMKISTADLDRKDGIEKRISGTAGQKYETIESMKNITQLDRLNDSSAVVLMEAESGSSLSTVALP